MKATTDFDFIQSQPLNFGQNDLILQYDDQNEQKNIEQEQNNQIDKQLEQQSYLKTPQSKKSRKSSLKNNPQDIGTPKTNKIKQKKYKSMQPVDKQKNPNQLFGHWSIEQNKRYHWFLQIYNSHFMNRSLRRMDRIFTSMAKFVSTREAQQCRSHHQKMQKKYKTFPKILLNLRNNHYSSSQLQLLRDDIQKNEIKIIQPLLTQQFLHQNINIYLTMSIPSQQGLDSNNHNSQIKQKSNKQSFINNNINNTNNGITISSLSTTTTKLKRQNYSKQSKQKNMNIILSSNKSIISKNNKNSKSINHNNNKLKSTDITCNMHIDQFQQQKISHYYNNPKNLQHQHVQSHQSQQQQLQQQQQQLLQDENMMQSIMIAPDMQSSRNFFRLPPSYLNPDEIDPQVSNLFGELNQQQQHDNNQNYNTHYYNYQ